MSTFFVHILLLIIILSLVVPFFGKFLIFLKKQARKYKFSQYEQVNFLIYCFHIIIWSLAYCFHIMIWSLAYFLSFIVWLVYWLDK